jgi:hypothetical protein
MNTTFNENGTMSYIPVRRVKFIPEKSVGDPVTDIIVIPNIPLLVSNYLVMIRINLDFCRKSLYAFNLIWGFFFPHSQLIELDNEKYKYYFYFLRTWY